MFLTFLWVSCSVQLKILSRTKGISCISVFWSGIQLKGHLRLPRVSIWQVIENVGIINYAWIWPILSPRFPHVIVSLSLQVTQTPYLTPCINHVAKSTVKVAPISMILVLTHSGTGVYLAISVLNFMPFSSLPLCMP